MTETPTPETPTPEPLLALDSVTVRYGRTVALHEACLDLPAGSLTAVLGPSGCGKTTLLRAVAGLEPIVAGTVRIAGRTVAGPGCDVPAERRGVGLVPQDGALFPHLTVRGNIGYGLRRRDGRAARIDEMLDLVDLRAVAERRPAELSGGQRQRVALARALAPSPSLIGLDEPFSALDAGLRSALRAEVAALLRITGTTALLVTHDPVEALATADRVVVLLDGRIRQIGAPEAVYRRPVDARVGELFGELNRIGGGESKRFARPHELVLARAGTPGALVTGVVRAVEFRGAHRLVTVVPGAGHEEVLVAAPGDGPAPEPGTRVAVLAEPRGRTG
ncbi:MAG: ABC transporter ATP-binding protein [Gordonia sp. (in: high G+C Gram-positive bacteria)]|uniref:ABC transporter ATP-binding protein n=1 Tax=Gordonia sp. (in: high G+C Gram-positive bacteria) TaxID=84139 RepID=UPI0039E6BC49